MNKTISYVNLFRNVKDGVKTWGMTFRVGEGDHRVDVGCREVPEVDLRDFAKKVSKDGKTTYLGSKYPLVVEHSDLREGRVAGRFFANVSSISPLPRADERALDAMLDAADAPKAVEPAKDEPKAEAATDAF